MPGIRLLRAPAALALVAFVTGFVAPPAFGWHYYRQGWRDRHYNYPRVPYGYHEIVDVFGRPCGWKADNSSTIWRAADNDVWYVIRFHKRLGDETSSNLDNDVRGHIGNQHLDDYLRSGMWGYACRYMRGGTAWSTHAWGIAIDVSTRREPAGQCWSEVNRHHAPIWKDHRWTWGKRWCDPMHFQYADGY